jgi:hypothetical protein
VEEEGRAEKSDFEILTAEIAKAAFGITPGKHKKIKGLKREKQLYAASPRVCL